MPIACSNRIMNEYTLVDWKTGLIHGPYETCAMARTNADAKAIATWEIITENGRLIDWSRSDAIDGGNK